MAQKKDVKKEILMIILAIETTSQGGSLAIQKGNQIIYQDYFAMRSSHSETIMPKIDSTLKLFEIDKKELSAVCVSIGPGSFTGCRIGLATAKGICTGLKIPLLAFNTLEILAANIYGTNKRILSILDARMNEIYIAEYDSFLLTIKEPCCKKYSDIFQGMKGDYICVGDIHLLPNEITNKSLKIIKALPHQNILSAAAMMSLLDYKNINLVYDKEYIHNIEPFYVRGVN